MVVYEKFINLTVDEVKRCSKEHNGVVSFITGTVPNTEAFEEKTTYRDILREKLKDAVDGRSEFTFADPPRSSSATNISFYVQCEHRKGKGFKTMAVSFAKADHVIGKELRLKFKSVCDLCEGKDIPNVQSNDHVVNQSIRIDGNAEFRENFKAIRGRFEDLFNKIENECCMTSNPTNHLRTNIAKFGLDANLAMINGISAFQDTSDLANSSGASGSSTIVTPIETALLDMEVEQQSIPSSVASPSIVNSTTPSSFVASGTSSRIVTQVVSPSSFVVMEQASFSSPSSVYPVTPQNRISFSSISPFSPNRDVSVTNSLSTTPIMASSVGSAEKLAMQAASDVLYQNTPKSSGKRSARALLAQKIQENNISKKNRGV